MKQFAQMTATELKEYDGPVYWARIQTINQDKTGWNNSDLEAPSLDLLNALIKSIPGARVYDNGTAYQSPQRGREPWHV